jgi:hypothetical protein
MFINLELKFIWKYFQAPISRDHQGPQKEEQVVSLDIECFKCASDISSCILEAAQLGADR